MVALGGKMLMLAESRGSWWLLMLSDVCLYSLPLSLFPPPPPLSPPVPSPRSEVSPDRVGALRYQQPPAEAPQVFGPARQPDAPQNQQAQQGEQRGVVPRPLPSSHRGSAPASMPHIPPTHPKRGISKILVAFAGSSATPCLDPSQSHPLAATTCSGLCPLLEHQTPLLCSSESHS